MKGWSIPARARAVFPPGACCPIAIPRPQDAEGIPCPICSSVIVGVYDSASRLPMPVPLGGVTICASCRTVLMCWGRRQRFTFVVAPQSYLDTFTDDDRQALADAFEVIDDEHGSMRKDLA